MNNKYYYDNDNNKIKIDNSAEFNVEILIKWASRYPEFEEKFIETFDSKELLEVYLKLTINVNNYLETGYDYDEGFFQKYNYETIIRDLGI